MVEMDCHQLSMSADFTHTGSDQRLNLRPVLDNECIIRRKRPHGSSDNRLGCPPVHLNFKDLRHRLSLTDLTP